MSQLDRYHCWAATQYRDKVRSIPACPRYSLILDQLDCDVLGKPWSPSPAHVSSSAPSSSAQGVRKSRTSARSPALGSQLPSKISVQALNNTPSPPSSDFTSAAAPSFSDFQENPGAAFKKGWSLFSAAVVGASRVVSESVIQPIQDPGFQDNVRGYVSEAQRRAQDVGHSVNEWSKTQLGVDVANRVGDIVDTVKDTIGPGPRGLGYDSVATQHEEAEASERYDAAIESSSQATAESQKPQQPATTHPTKKDDEWEDWNSL